MVEETPKIFEGPFKVGVTCVRVPVLRAHCESINLQFSRRVTLAEVYEVLNKAPGIRVVDDRVNNQHPEPQKVPTPLTLTRPNRPAHTACAQPPPTPLPTCPFPPPSVSGLDEILVTTYYLLLIPYHFTTHYSLLPTF